MKVRELQTILADYHPDEEIGLRSVSNRNMTFLGVHHELTSLMGHLVLSVDFTIKDKAVEGVRDQLVRQKEEINKAIAKLDKKELSKARERTGRRKTKKTDAQLLLDGYIRNGGVGRPRKIRTEQELKEEAEARARYEASKLEKQRKRTGTTEREVAESNQESNQPMDIFTF